MAAPRMPFAISISLMALSPAVGSRSSSSSIAVLGDGLLVCGGRPAAVDAIPGSILVDDAGFVVVADPGQFLKGVDDAHAAFSLIGAYRSMPTPLRPRDSATR